MKRLLLTAAAALVLAACNRDESAPSGGLSVIRIDPVIANPAVMPEPRSTRATDTDFEQGDAIGLSVTYADSGTKYLDNACLTYNAATSVFSSDAIWYEDINLKSDIFAYYPYAEGFTANYAFAVQTDQRGEGYAQSDLIAAVKKGVNPSSTATTLTFKHKMARLIVDITENSSGQNILSVSVGGVKHTGNIDPLTGDVTVSENTPTVPLADIIAREAVANKMYYALIFPQNGVKLTVTVTTADNRKRTYTLATADFASGENRRLPTKVDAAGGITVAFGGPIDAWTDGPDLDLEGQGGGENTVDWGGEQYKIVTLRDGRTWMAENLRYIPQGRTPSSDFAAEADGIWYPLKAEYNDLEMKHIGVVTTDAAVIRQHGYLYSFAAAMNVEAITEENSGTFEGQRGICPEGWHIPTEAEFTALIAQYLGEGQTVKASLDALEAAGFTCPLTGMRQKNTSATEGKAAGNCYQDHIMSGYFMTSTKVKYDVNATTGAITTQNRGAMLMRNQSNDYMSIALTSNLAGVPVRCIKDAQ